MKAYNAYCIALKNAEFKAMAAKIHNQVEEGTSHAASFQFIVDGQRFYFGYESIYDEEMQGNEIAPFYGRLGRVQNNRDSIRVKPIIIR